MLPKVTEIAANVCKRFTSLYTYNPVTNLQVWKSKLKSVLSKYSKIQT